MFLNREDQTLLNEIRDSETNKLLTGKASDGVPFLKHVYRLHELLFGETCSYCPSKITGYIQNLKKFNSNSKEMSTKEKKHKADFVLKKGKIVVIGGTSRSYSEHNITDEIALEILAKNKNRIEMFDKYPKDLDKRIEQFNKEQEAKAEEKAKAETEAKNKLEKEKKEASEKEVSFKNKVDVLFQNGYQRLLDKFQKGSKILTVEQVYNSSTDEFNDLIFEAPATPEVKEEVSASKTDVKDAEVVNPVQEALKAPEQKAETANTTKEVKK